MLSRRIQILLTLAVTCGLALSFAIGCDPKLTGEGGDGSGTGDGGGDGGTLEPSTEAIVVGAVLALHMELLNAGHTVAAEFDTITASPLPRTMFTTDCVTMTEIEPLEPRWQAEMVDCIDGRGTVHSGGGVFRRDGTMDGYTFFPATPAQDMIRADNTEDPSLSHTYSQGTFWFVYDRGGANEITGIRIGNYLRHMLLTQTASFSYVDVLFHGAPGSVEQWPTSGTIQGSWDGVGLFEATFTGGPVAHMVIQRTDYEVDLRTGDVTLEDSSIL
jgi:hypothetical protein